MSCGCDIKIINEENKIIVTEETNVIVISHADGRDGKSAYQQAVEGGYTGTEQEFNCSLSLLPDIAVWKQQIADAINYKGGEASGNSAFTQLAEDVKDIPNFSTRGCEYISNVYEPRTLLDAYYNRLFLKSVVDNYVEEISGSNVFLNCSSLQSVQMPNLVTIRGNKMFSSCTSLQNIEFPNLVTISGNQMFSSCTSLQNIEFPNLVTISGSETFQDCVSLQNVECPQLTTYPTNFFRGSQPFNITLGVLVEVSTTQYSKFTQARNIKIGQGTNINLPFQFWTATNVIAEGQSGIDELNSNLYNNLLTKLYDHSEDGETRILQIGWLAHVSQENIDYANSKGWTLTK